MERTVKNEYGVTINYEVAENLMDDELREEIVQELNIDSDQEFFNTYGKRHEEKFGEEWELFKKNPCY